VAESAAIAVGGDITVDAAARIAGDLGMSQTLIGLTIVSIGTSLPELVTSIVAAKKDEVDMALGNAIGSNVFNILMVLGMASAISPVSIITENIIDLCVLIVFTVCVWIFAGTKKKIGRVEGICMVAFYAAYGLHHNKIKEISDKCCCL
jgi:cation:H+ antiporter